MEHEMRFNNNEKNFRFPQDGEKEKSQLVDWYLQRVSKSIEVHYLYYLFIIISDVVINDKTVILLIIMFERR